MSNSSKPRTAPECGCVTTGKIVRGMCQMHYDRWVQKTPKGERPPPPTVARTFMDFVDKTSSDSGCWLWTGPTNRRGYGLWSGKASDGRRGLAHRLSLAEVEPAPDPSLLACHRCDNPPCVNPAHLYWGTKADNARDYGERQGIHNKGKYAKVCKRGHAIEGENLLLYGTARKRTCRECYNMRKRINMRKSRAARRESV